MKFKKIKFIKNYKILEKKYINRNVAKKLMSINKFYKIGREELFPICRSITGKGT